MGRVRVGTASWTDPEFIRAGWYPDGVKNDPEGRLRYYAERFDMVEVNASFYALPDPATVARWAERTPADFRFHMKAHQLISGHPCEPARLPPALRDIAPAALDRRGRIRRAGRDLRDAAIDMLLEAAAPLGDKLGAVLLQLPPFVAAGEAEAAEVARIVERMAPARVAVEFRHRSWVAPDQLEATLSMLGERDAALVSVDTPAIDVASALPTLLEVTTPALAYVRLHGRNAGTWQGSRTVAERFDYVYPPEELEEWVAPVLELAGQAQEVAVVFNNNARDHALRNAADFGDLVGGSPA